MLNYIDMMASGVQSRSQEIATLESIGMTTKQVRKMLGAEGGIYAVISIIISLAAGLPLSYLVFNAINLYAGVTYSIPLIRNIIFFAIIIIICIISPVIIYQKTQNTNITMRIRQSS